MKNLINQIKTTLGVLAFTGIVLAAPAGVHIKGIAKNYYIKNFSERYYDGRVPKISKETADKRIKIGNDMIYASLGIGSASLAGYIALNRINKKRESI